MKKFIFLLALLFSASPAWGQQVVLPCSKTATAPCAVASTTNPLPIAVYDSGNHSGYCYTSNGSGSAASFQVCGGGGGGGTVTLGTSTSAANPQISGDATSGFYTAGAALVDVAIGGNKISEWASTGVTVTGLATANGFSPTSSTAAGNRLYLPSSNAPAISANGVEVEQWNTVASGVDYLSVTPSATANPARVIIAAAGTDTNIGIDLQTVGTTGIIRATTASTSSTVSIDPIGGPITGSSANGNPAVIVRDAAGNYTNMFNFNGTSFRTLTNSTSALGARFNLTISSGTDVSNSGDLLFSVANWSERGRFSGVTGFFTLGTTGANGLSRFSLNGNAAIGSTYYSGTAAPTDGLIVQGVVGIGTATPRTGVVLDLGAVTTSMYLPTGTTGQRPTGIAGMYRYNSTTNSFEGFANSLWQTLFSGSSGTPTCGTGCSSITAGSTDARGSMTVGTTVTTATVNWSATLGYTPTCVISDNSTLATGDISAISTSAMTASFSAALTGSVVYWICVQ